MRPAGSDFMLSSTAEAVHASELLGQPGAIHAKLGAREVGAARAFAGVSFQAQETQSGPTQGRVTGHEHLAYPWAPLQMRANGGHSSTATSLANARVGGRGLDPVVILPP